MRYYFCVYFNIFDLSRLLGNNFHVFSHYDPKNDADNTRKFLGNEIPGAPVNAQPGDFFTAGNGITYEKLPYTTSNGGWKRVSKGKNEEEFKRFIDMNEKGINTRTDGTFIPKDLTSE